MILPHLKQFGAAVKSGCKEALQLHLRCLRSFGLVDTSSAAMAAVRSAILLVVVVGVPEPDDLLCDAVGAGELDLITRFVRTFGR
jgi:hypothetical protein